MNRQSPLRTHHLQEMPTQTVVAEQLQMDEASPETVDAAGLVKGAAIGIGSAAIVAALMYVRRR